MTRRNYQMRDRVMTRREAIQAALETTKGYLHQYLADFTDAELLVRPVPGANHAAWQVGNVIGGDIFFVTADFPDTIFPEASSSIEKVP